MIKRAVQVIGLLIGVGGTVIMLGILIPVIPLPGRPAETLDPYILLLALFVIGYLIFFNYLLWYRFSPRAIRHFCGAVACVLFGVVFVNAEAILGFLGISQPMFAMGTFFLIVGVYFVGTIVLNALTGMDIEADEKGVRPGPPAGPDGP